MMIQRYFYKHSTSKRMHQDPCKIERYFSLFSSAVPVHLVPSITHAFQDGIARVAARISAKTFSLSSRCCVPLPDGPPPLVVIAGVICSVCGRLGGLGP